MQCPSIDPHLTTGATMSAVTFIFQADVDGNATLTFDPPSVSPKPGVAWLHGETVVKILLMPPLGMPDSIDAVTLTFHQEQTQGWPFKHHDGPTILWNKGDASLKTRARQGSWKFGAVLTSHLGHKYIVPDPELHVGDGSGNGAAY
jgi:hypothetical protein